MAKKILIIEDDSDILGLMTDILTEEGYHVVPSADSLPLSNIYQYHPDLILLDNRLAEGSGYEFCAQFKSDPENSRYPVILVSADSELKNFAKESYADDYLAKPFNVDDLVSIVKKFV